MFDLSKGGVFDYSKVSGDTYKFIDANGIPYLVEICRKDLPGFSYIEPTFFPKEFSNYSPRKKYGYLCDHNRSIDKSCAIKTISTVAQITFDVLKQDPELVLIIYGYPVLKGNFIKDPTELAFNQRSRIYNYAITENLHLIKNYKFLGIEEMFICAYFPNSINQDALEDFLKSKTIEEYNNLADLES